MRFFRAAMSTATSKYPAPITREHDPAEQWKPVQGFESRYEVSSLGRVWSAVTRRILRPGPTSRGYLSVQLYFDETPKRSKSFCVHDLVAKAFIGRKPRRKQVDHRDGNKNNNAASNLRYVTQSENILNAVRLGRVHHKGSDHVNAKLTPSQVREIRRRRAAGATARSLAPLFKVSEDTICSVVSGRRYRNVT